ncbi:hypothetical protein MNBD_ALPHA06-2277 [hydrothermal vent metagenome]|uniref:DUF4164 family protein n=1 Tax=hydrothermal vent metagenome TaxID=652676 RepID=A0A3B0RS81_9ZZZZ
MSKTASNDSLQTAAKRLNRALDALENKTTQLLDRVQQARNVGEVDEDRARLAAELDEARSRAVAMEDAAREAGQALDAAIANVQAALGDGG